MEALIQEMKLMVILVNGLLKWIGAWDVVVGGWVLCSLGVTVNTVLGKLYLCVSLLLSDLNFHLEI